MRLVPKMKILHRTIFRPEIFPQVKTSLRSQVSASTNMRGPRRCSFSCISNHLQRKSLSTRKVITIFPLLGKNNIVVLMWFVLRQGMEKATLTRNRTKTLKLSWRHFCGATLLPIGIYSNPWLSINNYNSCFGSILSNISNDPNFELGRSWRPACPDIEVSPQPMDVCFLNSLLNLPQTICI